MIVRIYNSKISPIGRYPTAEIKVYLESMNGTVWCQYPDGGNCIGTTYILSKTEIVVYEGKTYRIEYLFDKLEWDFKVVAPHI